MVDKGSSAGSPVAGVEYSEDEAKRLADITDPRERAKMAAELRLRKAQDALAFIANTLKKKNEMAKTIVHTIK